MSAWRPPPVRAGARRTRATRGGQTEERRLNLDLHGGSSPESQCDSDRLLSPSVSGDCPLALARTGRRERRNRVRWIWPVHSRQVMQCDPDAPTVGSRPDEEHHQHTHHRHPQYGMRTDHSEIDQDDEHGNGQPITEDGEGPGITGIPCEDQAAGRTAFDMRPSGKQSPLAAVRTPLAQPAPKGRADQRRAQRCHCNLAYSARPCAASSECTSRSSCSCRQPEYTLSPYVRRME
jgi:hypothetical protein